LIAAGVSSLHVQELAIMLAFGVELEPATAAA